MNDTTTTPSATTFTSAPAARASFDNGLADIATRLVARFGGRVVERYVDGPR